MNNYQLLTLLVAIIAVIISAISLIRTGKVQRQQIKLNALTEELSKKQLDIISKDELTGNKARVEADFQPYGSNYQLTLTNSGRVAARDVMYDFIDCPKSPVVDDLVLPVSILQPSQTIKFLATRSFESPSSYTVDVFWTDPDGSEKKERYILTV